MPHIRLKLFSNAHTVWSVLPIMEDATTIAYVFQETVGYLNTGPAMGHSYDCHISGPAKLSGTCKYSIAVSQINV